MTVLNKQDIPRPVLPKETVPVPELGGDVVVQSLLLREQLELSQLNGNHSARVSRILSPTVVDAQGEPIFTVDEWEAWGASHNEAVARLLEVASRLSGLVPSEKKESAPS